MCSVPLPFILRRRSRIQSVRSLTELQPTQSLIKCNVMLCHVRSELPGGQTTPPSFCPRIPYWPAEAVSGTRPPLDAPGGASSAERTGLRADVADGFAATPVLVPGLPAPLDADPAAALALEGSVPSGPAG